MDSETRRNFVAHVQDLERRAIEGDGDAAKSLACMALLVDGFSPDDGGGAEIVDMATFRSYLRAA